MNNRPCWVRWRNKKNKGYSLVHVHRSHGETVCGSGIPDERESVQTPHKLTPEVCPTCWKKVNPWDKTK